MYEAPLLFDNEPQKLDFIRPDRPYSRYGDPMVKGSFGDGGSYGEMTVKLEYEPSDRLEVLLTEVIQEMSALCESPRPENAQRLKILEMDHILLSIQRDHPDDREPTHSVLELLEITEQKIEKTYQQLGELPGFAEWFSMRLDEELEGDETPSKIVAAEETAFDELIRATYDNDELQELHDLAVEAKTEIAIQAQLVELAKQITPRAAKEANKTVTSFDESMLVKVHHSELAAA